MNLKRKCKVVMLPTNEKAIIGLNPVNNKLIISSEIIDNKFKRFIEYNGQTDKFRLAQHLYILSDEEIKESDSILNHKTGVIERNLKTNEIHLFYELEWKKIIASTDKPLDLPEPSSEFIQKYINAYNSGNPITEVMVEWGNISEGRTCDYIDNKPKVNKSNQISITKVKDNWSREEVESLLYKYADESGYLSCKDDYNNLKNWCSRNL